jgi:membrane fusion protein (multidrug efflux system)
LQVVFCHLLQLTEKTVIMKLLTKMKAIQCVNWCLVAFLVFAVSFAAACGSGNGTTKAGPLGKGAAKGGRGGGPGAGGPVLVQTTTVHRIAIQRDVDLAGSLISPDQAKVSSEVAGVVQHVLVELGDEVKAGQIVAKLDPRELELALYRAESQLHQTEAQLGIDGVRIKEPPPDEQISSVRMAIANRDDAHAQLRRAQRLRSQNLLSQADLDTAETKVKVTEANYQAAIENVQSLKATLQERRHATTLAQKKLNDTNIRSSIAGQISERLVQQGEFIRENTPVVSVVQMNPLKVRTAIQERYAGLVRSGLPVEFSVEAAPGQKFTGKVAYVSPSVDQTTRTFAVEVLVDNSNRRLKPGFFAKGVILTYRDENVMAVPDDAVSTLAGVSNVYVIEQGRIRQQSVSLGERVGDLFELLGGLKGDETLASSNLTMLATGVPVRVAGARGSDIPSQAQQPGMPGVSAAKEGGRP